VTSGAIGELVEVEPTEADLTKPGETGMRRKCKGTAVGELVIPGLDKISFVLISDK
jgi:hypothetical protein